MPALSMKYSSVEFKLDLGPNNFSTNQNKKRTSFCAWGGVFIRGGGGGFNNYLQINSK